ncbi:N-acetylmannosamine-6-phosphate 2-epimerase [Pseudomonas sp. 91RF]|uniref:N-acetylmannosamine-6-phosphate 2-epimerase n=1 Tax=Pseudomonas sp. 91RF TaxID=2292261 RepID=UPI000E66859C|nr:N-acetylmannosamine-6-phosphate 2-epimerase [Pseudomonas sp. 91RF]RIJ12856.1 N-acetylmannosamine-6-phosphate 2-epimerase [Pseudomonas sp. 91RF]
METSNWFSRLKGRLVVSCQALEDEPLHGSAVMCRMAQAARMGGASAILANGGTDIAAIRASVDLPIIGVINRVYADSVVTLTATMREVDELMAVGPDMIGVEATLGLRPGGETLTEFVTCIRLRYPHVRLMADVATVEEARLAECLGFDCVSSAFYGHTEGTIGQHLPAQAFAHLRALRKAVTCPLWAEGGITTPEQAAAALAAGADTVVVGSAITRPQTITARFVVEMARVISETGLAPTVN